MRLLLTLLLFLSASAVIAQSETHNMVTYDTTVAYIGQGANSQRWVLRITRPVNYFTAGNFDTTSRPAIITMQGDGEVSGGNYTFINSWGPHNWLVNGWDGSVVLGNGIHYPILITLQQNAVNTRANLTQNIMDSIIKKFHPRGIMLGGLSGGVEVFGWYMEYQAILGDEHNMANVKAFVNLQGVGPTPSNLVGVQPLPYPAPFGYWARKYHGRYFGLIGTNDLSKKSVYEISQNMNDSVPGSAYMSVENIGGGAHCCWNDMYNPSTLNWTNTIPFGNANIVTNTNIPNTAGNYVYSATTGTNIFQWMLRQGDTTLIVPPTPDKPRKVGDGEYQKVYIDPLGQVWSLSGSPALAGQGPSTIPRAVLGLVATPDGMVFNAAFPGLHTMYLRNSAGVIYAFGDNTMGQGGNGDTTSPMYTPRAITVDSLGNTFNNIAGVAPFYLANVAEGACFWKYNNDTLWECGRTMYGARGDGTYGSTATLRPTAVYVMPGGRTIADVTAGQVIMILATDGTVWTCGNGKTDGTVNNYQDLGNGATGSQFLNLRQVTGMPGIKMIAGGLSFNQAVDSSGSLWGWGFWPEYFGSVLGTPQATPKKIDSLITQYLDGPISQIVCNKVSTHIITTRGTLWGYGNNAEGTLGNGQQLDWSQSVPCPGCTFYSWNIGRTGLIQQRPVQITTKHDFNAVYGGMNFVFSVTATDSSNLFYEAGCNKGNVLHMNIFSANALMEGPYRDSWNRPDLTPVNKTGNPWSPALTTGYPTTSPGCITGDLTGSPCNLYTLPINIPPTANAGPSQTTTGTSIVLDGSGSTDDVFVSYYHWSQVSGPNTAAIQVPGAMITKAEGLVAGVYIFQLTVKDNEWDSTTAQVAVQVGTLAAPIVNAGPDVTVTLPVISVSLSGSVNGNGAAITSILWTQVSGPNTATISPTNTAMSTVSNLTQGVYVFKLTATNANNLTSSATMTLTAGSCNCLNFSIPTSIQK